MRITRILPVACAMVALASCSRQAPPTDPQYVAQWLRSSLSFVRSERLGPPVAARISAYGALALYEGYAADPASGLRTLAGQLNGLASLPTPPAEGAVDGAIAAAEAERVVLDSLFRDGFASTRRTIDSLARAQVEGRVVAGVSEAQRDRSIAHGQALGAAILAWAATDGFFDTRKRTWPPPEKREQWANTITLDQFVPLMLSGESDLVAPSNPGVAMELERAGERFVFTNRPKNAAGTTLPTFNPVRPTEPYWGELRPFAIRDGDECRPPAPPTYSEKEGSDFWKMGREYADSIAALTPEKKQIALFWADNPVATGTPGFHWISVVNQMIAKRNLTAPQAAELFALTSVAIADAFIGCWKEKYRSMVVRPVAYMHRVFDKEFTTVIPTPPFPEYTSGHSVQSAAAVEVLKALVGDSIAFSDSTQVDVGQPPRDFVNFSAALQEVAVSRIYAGVHYVPAVVDGMQQGICIGGRVLERLKTRKEGE
ncbi:MAG: vanadium-dependent haloperoxidase [Gemmatimonadota bacterium]